MQRADVTIVVPTYREAENLPRLLPRILDTLENGGLTGGVIIVDDSSGDGTAMASVAWWSLFIVVFAVMRRVARPSMSPLQEPASLIAFVLTLWLVLTMMGCTDTEREPDALGSSPA